MPKENAIQSVGTVLPSQVESRLSQIRLSGKQNILDPVSATVSADHQVYNNQTQELRETIFDGMDKMNEVGKFQLPKFKQICRKADVKRWSHQGLASINKITIGARQGIQQLEKILQSPENEDSQISHAECRRIKQELQSFEEEFCQFQDNAQLGLRFIYSSEFNKPRARGSKSNFLAKQRCRKMKRLAHAPEHLKPAGL